MHPAASSRHVSCPRLRRRVAGPAAAALLAACGGGAGDVPADTAASVAPAAPVALTLPSTWTGRLPAADGPGIDYTLVLHPDSVFYLRTSHVDRPDGTTDDIGRWSMGSDGRTLTLRGGREAPVFFEVTGERTIRKLDVAGEPIVSSLPYELARADSAPVLEPRLDLRGMYRYMADAATFTECLTGRTFPVAMEADNIALERGYRASMPPNGPGGEPVLVLLAGRIARRPPAEEAQGGLRETLVPEKFRRAVPGETCAGGGTSAAPGGATTAALAQGSVPGAELVETRWKLVRLGADSVSWSDVGRDIHVRLRRDDRRVEGFTGCNRVTGSYSASGEQLSFGTLASTKMACAGAGMAIEPKLLAALAATASWRIAGTRLTMRDASGAALAEFEPLLPR